MEEGKTDDEKYEKMIEIASAHPLNMAVAGSL